MATSLEEDIIFIKEDLVPEMVHNRCFCDSGSREFVELESVQVESANKYLPDNLLYSFYRAQVIVRFSDIPQTFRILIKLLPADADPESHSYAGFLNEEILWNKGKLFYNQNFFSRFYLADMGKYGRPVVCVEDLERCGYERVLDRSFNTSEAKLVIDLAARFYASGLSLRRNDFSSFREFYRKFQDTGYPDIKKQILQTDRSNESDSKLSKEELDECLLNKESILAKFPNALICIGCLVPENLWFKRLEGGEVTDVCLLDWQHVRLGPAYIDKNSILEFCEEKDRDLLNEFYNEILQDLEIDVKI